MGRAINRVLLVGRLGGPPELRHTPTGRTVLRCRLATTEHWTGQDGREQERTDWHTVVVWGRRGEALARLLGKGLRVGIEGRLRSRQWQTPEGERRASVEVEATEVVLLDAPRGALERASSEEGRGPERKKLDMRSAF